MTMPPSTAALTPTPTPTHLQVLHSINAWELPRHFPGLKLDVVAWNHPHLGVEDFRLHKFLMAHFFESLRNSLKADVCLRRLPRVPARHCQCLCRDLA
jgi:hypothetical protein